jgi:phosphoribosylanthranilate isomerase
MIKPEWRYPMTAKQIISAHMSKLGKIGGAKSKRTLTTEQAREMAAMRKPKKALGKPGDRTKHTNQ